jgi:hypothetical protein
VTAGLEKIQPNPRPPSQNFNDGNLARRQRAKSHSDVIDINTGWELDPERWAACVAASKALENESERLADALGRTGVNVRVPSEITMIGAVTGKTEIVAGFRAVRFLPSVAARDRRPLLNGLTYFIQSHPASNYFRYQVFTAPEPVPIGGELRITIQALSRKISRWVSHQSANFDVEPLFRGIEFTRATAAERRMEDRYPANTILYHVHANLVVWPTKPMKPTEWDDYLKSTWKKFEAHWRDNGRLQNANEVVKYVLKPGCLTGASDEEIAWLYDETRQLKISQPLGAFARFMAELEDAGEKIVRVKGTRDGKLVKVGKATRLDHAKREATSEQNLVETTHRQKPSLPPTNIILGLSLPQRRFTPWAEPLILVQRYKPTATSNGDLERLDAIGAEMQWARMKWDENGAPPPAEALNIAALHLPTPIIERPQRFKGAAKSAAPAVDFKVHTSRPTVPLHKSVTILRSSPSTDIERAGELGCLVPRNVLNHCGVTSVAHAIATQSRSIIGAISFIKERIASMEQDFENFGGTAPPTLETVMRWLRHPESRPNYSHQRQPNSGDRMPWPSINQNLLRPTPVGFCGPLQLVDQTLILEAYSRKDSG